MHQRTVSLLSTWLHVLGCDACFLSQGRIGFAVVGLVAGKALAILAPLQPLDLKA